MKKFLSFFAIAALMLGAVACSESDPTDPNNPDPVVKLVNLTIQLSNAGSDFKVEGIPVSLANTSGSASYELATDASGKAVFQVPAGNYVATAFYSRSEGGVKYNYSGAANAILSDQMSSSSHDLVLYKVESEQIIIKELYNGGCMDNAGAKGYSNDMYLVLYNNSDSEADASDIVITFSAPYNGQATGTAVKYFDANGVCIYQHESWQPAYGAIWWFKEPVKIPAYSQIVIAIFGAIDHTATYANSVDLSKSEYYWMSNKDISTVYKMAKYAVSENIPASHYLTTKPFTQGTAWALSNSAPAVYIGKMSSADVLSLVDNTEGYDHTMGTTAAYNVVKFPKANIVDAIEVWKTADIAKSLTRFSPEINNGYVTLTNQKGHTLYRNVDKAATEALAENAGKLVYNYAGGFGESTDPSGIDAEASIAAGAHIIYSETNNSAKDFHERTVASIKK